MLIELDNSSKKQVTKVRLEWRDGRNNTETWNEICTWCLEHYGLPGNNFEWHPETDFMDFHFYNERDAIHFMLRWS